MNPKDIPAFPFIDSASPLEHPGMTLRDYFAAKAMAAAYLRVYESGDNIESLAREAYAIADAMMNARNSHAHDK